MAEVVFALVAGLLVCLIFVLLFKWPDECASKSIGIPEHDRPMLLIKCEIRTCKHSGGRRYYVVYMGGKSSGFTFPVQAHETQVTKNQYDYAVSVLGSNGHHAGFGWVLYEGFDIYEH